MKKLLVLLTLLVGIFGFSAGAFSQVCTSCGGTDVRNVDCTGEVQGTCRSFDYDEDHNTGSGYDGWCAESQKENYRLIFNLCKCADATATFDTGTTLGIRMTILVDNEEGENGAYWSGTFGPVGGTINFAYFKSETAACAGTTTDHNFGPAQYFEHDGTPVAALAADTACPVATVNQATVLTAESYTIWNAAPDLIIDYAKSHWWIDVPGIRIDPAVLNSGERISVKVELYTPGSGGICAECEVVCDCTIDVADVCCDVALSSELLFPYFTALGAHSFWNGIAIMNRTSVEGTATLTAYEMDGAGTATVKVTVPAKGLYVKAVEDIDWDGTFDGNLPVYIEVTTDYAGADGFAMIAKETTGESMGYLPRQTF